MPEKRVLLIAHDFPPIRSSGIYRPAKFAKYLPEFGWTPVVLSAEPFGTGTRDDSLLSQLPSGIRIHRANRPSLIDAEAELYLRLFGRDPRPDAVPPAVAHQHPNAAVPPRAGHSIKSILLSRILSPARRALQHVLYFPDDANLWALEALRLGRRILSAERVDVIYSTSSPASSHLVGHLLSRQFGIPHVTEFRDPWSRNIPRRLDPPLRKMVERRLEHRVLRHAARIIYISDRLAQQARETFADLPADRFVVIENGYDEADFGSLPPFHRAPGLPLRLLNVGTIYSSAGFEAVLQSIEQVRRDRGPDAIRLIHVGPLLGDQKERLSAPDIADCVELRGTVPHSQIATLMNSVDIHLLTVPDGDESRPANIPGKVYEQLRSGRPILYVGARGDSWNRVADAAAGWTLTPQEQASLTELLQSLVDQATQGTLRSGALRERVQRFERRELTRALADVLDAAASPMRS